MATEVQTLSATALLLLHSGNVTFEELNASYTQILQKAPHYLLGDGLHMIYSLEVLQDERLTQKIMELMKQPTFVRLFLVIPKEHPLRNAVLQMYIELGYIDRLELVHSREEGIQIIRTLEQKISKSANDAE